MRNKVQTGSQMVPKAAVRWSLIFVFLINAGITLFVAYGSMNRDAETARISATQVKALHDIKANTAKNDKLTGALQKALTTQCNDRNTAAKGTNAVLDNLIEATKGFNLSKVFTAADRNDRLALYRSIKIKIIDCAITVNPSQYKVADQNSPFWVDNAGIVAMTSRSN